MVNSHIDQDNGGGSGQGRKRGLAKEEHSHAGRRKWLAEATGKRRSRQEGKTRVHCVLLGTVSVHVASVGNFEALCVERIRELWSLSVGGRSYKQGLRLRWAFAIGPESTSTVYNQAGACAYRWRVCVCVRGFTRVRRNSAVGWETEMLR